MWPFGDTRRITRLEDDFRALAADFKGLELEWTNVYDKLRKVMGRVVKSRAIIEANENGEAVQTGALSALTTASGPASGLLTDRQKAIQQQILRRRAGG